MKEIKQGNKCKPGFETLSPFSSLCISFYGVCMWGPTGCQELCWVQRLQSSQNRGKNWLYQYKVICEKTELCTGAWEHQGEALGPRNGLGVHGGFPGGKKKKTAKQSLKGWVKTGGDSYRRGVVRVFWWKEQSKDGMEVWNSKAGHGPWAGTRLRRASCDS